DLRRVGDGLTDARGEGELGQRLFVVVVRHDVEAEAVAQGVDTGLGLRLGRGLFGAGAVEGDVPRSVVVDLPLLAFVPDGPDLERGLGGGGVVDLRAREGLAGGADLEVAFDGGIGRVDLGDLAVRGTDQLDVPGHLPTAVDADRAPGDLRVVGLRGG